VIKEPRRSCSGFSENSVLPIGEAADNMAEDSAQFEAVVAGRLPLALRLYRWKPWAVSVGRFQDMERAVNAEFCKREGIATVRRPTGGRAVLHGDDLTVSLAASVEALGLPIRDSQNILAIYRAVGAAYIAAFRDLGIEARLGSCARPIERTRSGDCFATVSQADIVEARTGRKLLGAALYRRERWFLQQASIPLHSPDNRERLEALSSAIFCGKFQHGAGASPLDLDALQDAVWRAFQTLVLRAEKTGMTEHFRPD
jgi:lipoate-protein ligase A